MANRYNAASGGSGAGYHAIIEVTSTGKYAVSVGSGGVGYGGPRGSNATGGNGKATTITKVGGGMSISAGGGTGGFASGSGSGATAGTGGVITKSGVTEEAVYSETNGTDGNRRTSAGTISGVSGPLSGHTWGSTGDAKCSSNGGHAYSSTHGYLYIRYLGLYNTQVTYTINPTPNDATVVLESEGYTQVGNSITVPIGIKVNWSVSKEGYATQSGTAYPEENTTVSISLKTRVVYDTAGTYSLTISGGNYSIKMVGGGGGGIVWRSSSQTPYYHGGGGSGAYVGIDSISLSAGTYTIVVGGGGAKRTSSGTAGAGGNTTFSDIVAGGGKGASTYSGGAGGSYTAPSVFTRIEGKSGVGYTTSSASGGASVYNGYGAGGSASSSSANNGVAGYFEILEV